MPIDGDIEDGTRDVHQPFTQKPEPGVASTNYRIDSLLSRTAE